VLPDPPPQPQSTRDIELKQQTAMRHLNLDIRTTHSFCQLDAVWMALVTHGLPY
jgi:hypothetical protein